MSVCGGIFPAREYTKLPLGVAPLPLAHRPLRITGGALTALLSSLCALATMSAGSRRRNLASSSGVPIQESQRATVTSVIPSGTFDPAGRALPAAVRFWIRCTFVAKCFVEACCWITSDVKVTNTGLIREREAAPGTAAFASSSLALSFHLPRDLRLVGRAPKLGNSASKSSTRGSGAGVTALTSSAVTSADSM